MVERVWMPDSVEYISTAAFNWMNNLKYVRLSKNVKAIYGDPFGFCSRVYSINLPDGISYIHPSAFGGLQDTKYMKLGAVENSLRNEPHGFGLNIPGLEVVSLPYSYNATPFLADPYNTPDKIIISTTGDMATNFLQGIPDTTKVYCYVDESAGWPEGWNQDCTTYYKDEWHLATFYADDIIVTMEPLTLGDVVQTPADSFVTDFLPLGSQFLGWDINGDGKVNNKDASRLFQYLSGWDVEVDMSRLDINGDGKVNNKDASRLFQYLSGWDVEIR